MKRKKLTWVKNSRMGRFLCKVLGDNAGAVAMEYVVIALLVAAAVVGLVMVFGGTIADMFATTTKTLVGEEGIKEAKEMREAQKERTNKGISEQKATGNQIRGQKEESSGEGD